MAITLDTSAVVEENVITSTLSGSFTVAAGSDRCLVAVVGGRFANTTNANVSALTYNGVSLSRIIRTVYDDGAGSVLLSEIWALVAPATGSNTLSLTFTGADSLGSLLGAISFQGVNQSTPTEASNGSNTAGDSTSLSTGITTSSANAFLVAMARCGDTGALSPDGGQTEFIDQGLFKRYGAWYKDSGAAGADTMDFSWTGAQKAVQSVIALTPSGGGDPAPSITDVDEDNTVASAQANVEVDGADFDTAAVEVRQGSFDYACSIDSQDADTIVFDMPDDSATEVAPKHGAATVAVINGDDQEDTQAITIAPASGTDYVDLASVETEADNRLTAVPDLEIGDQVQWGNVVGTGVDETDVVVNDDGTFDAAEAVESFDVRVWDHDDSTWGSWATQSINASESSGEWSAVVMRRRRR